MTRRVLVIGSGKRVCEAALPALERLPQSFEIAGVLARTAKTIDARGSSYDVRALDGLSASALSEIQLIYLAVTKDAVPSVLARLVDMDVGAIDLLIDTPVVRFKHFHHARHLNAFRNAWVAEDCSTLPWMDTLDAAVDSGLLGRVERVELDRSAYAYHGLATAKTLLGATRVRSASRKPRRGESGQRLLRFAGGLEAHITEPRDYSVGRLRLVGSKASVSDRPANDQELHLEPIGDGQTWSGFRIGDIQTAMNEDEIALAAGDPAGENVIARMDAMKRVGFYRLLRSIDAGKGAYPVEEAMDDMVVDYHLEKIGRYLANPLTSARSGLARALLSTVTKLGSR